MPEFYHNLITEKSFKILQDLKQKFQFILIGGWAIFLYSQALKSKDIDIILDYDELGKFRKEFELFKNERLKKYEVKIGEIDIDIYLPYFSNLGMPVEEIQNYCQSIEGFLVPIPEILLILKTYAYESRKGTNKGKKDLIDIFSLIKKETIDWQKYQELVKKYHLKKINKQLKDLISSTKSLSELNLLNHKISRLKKKALAEIEL
ncbi:hypothetical protein KKE74_00090 [Patescibacteria group bacterium]|nr:hypothetical protein [Patescibacteria group bacterium]